MARMGEMKDIESFFKSGPWRPAADIARLFVRHADLEPSPGRIWRYPSTAPEIHLSVVIPTLDGDRGGRLSGLLDQVAGQDLDKFEIIIVKGDPRQGRAINIGAALARGRYLMTLDDDTALPDSMTFSKLQTVLEVHRDIGIAGGNNIVPEDAKSFVRRVMQEIPRRSWEMVSRITDSDLAEHPCLMMRTGEFKALGGENELIPRGLDPYLRQAYRQSNKRVVVVPGVVYHHLPPENLRLLLCQFYRNGRQASFTNRYYPDWVIETPAVHGAFKIKRSPVFRLLRFPSRLTAALVTGKPLWLLAESAYGFGFIHEWIRSDKMQLRRSRS
jgi:glycosyltransferase involved in cell wall biosynthesis